tara:strand:- start:233 stop:853 length:621 start_codon:yes stop_codon:yes gene_type:complete
MNDLQRVFIHEIGHFVAAELNYVIFNYDRRTEQFNLTPRVGTKFYNGLVHNSKATKDSYSIKTCANEYVQSFYGCLFEVLYRDIELDKCLRISVSKDDHLIHNYGNGKIDAMQIFGIGQRKEIKEFSKLWYDYISKEFYKEMKSISNHFELVFNLDVKDFILKEYSNKSFDIDIIKLLKSLGGFLELHRPIFFNLINKLYSIQGIK